jgi:hypothetical protein
MDSDSPVPQVDSVVEEKVNEARFAIQYIAERHA